MPRKKSPERELAEQMTDLQLVTERFQLKMSKSKDKKLLRALNKEIKKREKDLENSK